MNSASGPAAVMSDHAEGRGEMHLIDYLHQRHIRGSLLHQTLRRDRRKQSFQIESSVQITLGDEE